MTIKAKPSVLATPTVFGNDLVGATISSSNSPSHNDLQDIAAAVVAERYRLPPHLARTVCELACIGGAA